MKTIAVATGDRAGHRREGRIIGVAEVKAVWQDFDLEGLALVLADKQRADRG